VKNYGKVRIGKGSTNILLNSTAFTGLHLVGHANVEDIGGTVVASTEWDMRLFTIIWANFVIASSVPAALNGAKKTWNVVMQARRMSPHPFGSK